MLDAALALFGTGIWSKVAELKQIVEEGYLTEEMRTQAIQEYNEWIETKAEQMTMRLKEVRGRVAPR